MLDRFAEGTADDGLTLDGHTHTHTHTAGEATRAASRVLLVLSVFSQGGVDLIRVIIRDYRAFLVLPHQVERQQGRPY